MTTTQSSTLFKVVKCLHTDIAVNMFDDEISKTSDDLIELRWGVAPRWLIIKKAREEVLKPSKMGSAMLKAIKAIKEGNYEGTFEESTEKEAKALIDKLGDLNQYTKSDIETLLKRINRKFKEIEGESEEDRERRKAEFKLLNKRRNEINEVRRRTFGILVNRKAEEELRSIKSYIPGAKSLHEKNISLSIHRGIYEETIIKRKKIDQETGKEEWVYESRPSLIDRIEKDNEDIDPYIPLLMYSLSTSFIDRKIKSDRGRKEMMKKFNEIEGTNCSSGTFIDTKLLYYDSVTKKNLFSHQTFFLYINHMINCGVIVTKKMKKKYGGTNINSVKDLPVIQFQNKTHLGLLNKNLYETKKSKNKSHKRDEGDGYTEITDITSVHYVPIGAREKGEGFLSTFKNEVIRCCAHDLRVFNKGDSAPHTITQKKIAEKTRIKEDKVNRALKEMMKIFYFVEISYEEFNQYRLANHYKKMSGDVRDDFTFIPSINTGFEVDYKEMADMNGEIVKSKTTKTKKTFKYYRSTGAVYPGTNCYVPFVHSKIKKRKSYSSTEEETISITKSRFSHGNIKYNEEGVIQKTTKGVITHKNSSIRKFGKVSQMNHVYDTESCTTDDELLSPSNPIMKEDGGFDKDVNEDRNIICIPSKNSQDTLKSLKALAIREEAMYNISEQAEKDSENRINYLLRKELSKKINNANFNRVIMGLHQSYRRKEKLDDEANRKKALEEGTMYYENRYGDNWGFADQLKMNYHKWFFSKIKSRNLRKFKDPEIYFPGEDKKDVRRLEKYINDIFKYGTVDQVLTSPDIIIPDISFSDFLEDVYPSDQLKIIEEYENISLSNLLKKKKKFTPYYNDVAFKISEEQFIRNSFRMKKEEKEELLMAA